MSEHKANLDAWQVLQTVIDAGGFAQAAVQLKRSQSAVSYSISKLEKQLELELLTIQGRKAVLTKAGHHLLARSRRLLTDYRQLIGYADHLHAGHAAEINLWVDGIYPAQRLQNALLTFRQQSPLTRLNIQHGITQPDFDAFDIVISPERIAGKHHQLLNEIELLAVAHVHHPLFKLKAPLEPASLAPFIRVYLESESAAREAYNWPVTTLQQAKEYVLLGLAYGWLPVEIISNELESRLKPLPLTQGQNDRVSVYLHRALKSPDNPSVQKLAELIYLAN